MTHYDELIKRGGENVHPVVVGGLGAPRAVWGRFTEGGFVLTPAGEAVLAAGDGEGKRRVSKGKAPAPAPDAVNASDLFAALDAV